jgi:ATP-binding cassette subfamily C exporter for protease/lipase
MSALRYWVTQLAGLRGYFWQALGVSMVINALMVMPSLYMLQIYDRVMVSQSGLTLLTLTGLLTLSLLAAAWLEQRRTAILVRMGQALDDRLGVAAHDAALLKQWQRPSNSPLQPVQDLNALRQFVTGQGLFVLFDLPWFPIYLVIMFLLHPWLGVLGLVFSGVLLCIAVLSHRRSRAAIELGSDTARQAQQDQMTKLRNAELIHAMGMLPAVRQRWSERHAVYSSVQARAEATSASFSSLRKVAPSTSRTTDSPYRDSSTTGVGLESSAAGASSAATSDSPAVADSVSLEDAASESSANVGFGFDPGI